VAPGDGEATDVALSEGEGARVAEGVNEGAVAVAREDSVGKGLAFGVPLPLPLTVRESEGAALPLPPPGERVAGAVSEGTAPVGVSAGEDDA
jgi:hypothetical protein